MLVAAVAAMASVLAQGAANVQDDGSLVLKTGTTFAFKGVMVSDGRCEEFVPYGRQLKVSGRVILPEASPDVYSVVEIRGRDSGTEVLRIFPNGTGFMYFLGKEYALSLLGPVGSSFEMTEPESGQSLRFVIVGTGITVTLPTGAVYDNLTQMNTYCISCGPDPVRMESRWYSGEHPIGVLFREDNPAPCWPRWHWLVSITRK
jgi:hypothetical protein